MDEKKHAHLGDLPAWSSPLTVREIAEIKDFWGMVQVSASTVESAAIVYDERGLLWVDATKKPSPDFITGGGITPNRALIFHYEGGIGIYLPKLSYQHLKMISDLQREKARWGKDPRYIAVNHVASIEEIPEGVYADDPITRRLMAEHKGLTKTTLEGAEVPGER